MGRNIGFQRPLSKDQMISWVLQPLDYTAFIVLCVYFLEAKLAMIVLIPYSVLLITFASLWYYCESIDPSDETAHVYRFGVPFPKKETRYCTVCKKSSPGLDHHCTWLNTCIAENNYGPFYIMVVTATLQMLIQTICGILMTTVWFDDIMEDNISNSSTYQILFWFHNIASASLFLAYGSLAMFHTYLLCIQSGTYDWLILRQTKDKRKGRTRNSKPRPSKETDIHKEGVANEMTQKAMNDSQLEKEKWKADWLRRYSGDAVTHPEIQSPSEKSERRDNDSNQSSLESSLRESAEVRISMVE